MQGSKKAPCSVHCTTVFTRCTADKSCSGAVCTADFLSKKTWRNIQTNIFEQILNFDLHSFKRPLAQCVWLFISFSWVVLQRCICFVFHGIFYCSFLRWSASYWISLFLFYGKAAVFLFSVLTTILNNQTINIHWMFHYTFIVSVKCIV